MHQYAIAARSKLANFEQVISWCAERGVLSVRNANIVMVGRMASLICDLQQQRQTAKQEFISEVTVLGRALTKTFIHMPFVVTPYGFMIPFGEWALRERCSRHPSSKRYHE